MQNTNVFKTLKKKLNFLNNRERSDLSSSILKEKETPSANFKQRFLTSFDGYLNHFPVRKMLFTISVNLPGFLVLTFIFLEKLLGGFGEFGKKQNKYSELQMAWYLFTGKELNIATWTNIDTLL